MWAPLSCGRCSCIARLAPDVVRLRGTKTATGDWGRSSILGQPGNGDGPRYLHCSRASPVSAPTPSAARYASRAPSRSNHHSSRANPSHHMKHSPRKAQPSKPSSSRHGVATTTHPPTMQLSRTVPSLSKCKYRGPSRFSPCASIEDRPASSSVPLRQSGCHYSTSAIRRTRSITAGSSSSGFNSPGRNGR